MTLGSQSPLVKLGCLEEAKTAAARAVELLRRFARSACRTDHRTASRSARLT
jgi:hypothetical protein